MHIKIFLVEAARWTDVECFVSKGALPTATPRRRDAALQRAAARCCALPLLPLTTLLPLLPNTIRTDPQAPHYYYY